MTQVDPLAMVAYGIGIILLIKHLKAEFTGFTQPQYSENAGALSTFKKVELYFNYLKRFVLGCGYYPGPPKTFLVIHPDIIESVKWFGLCHGFKFFTGACYLGSFIGYKKFKRDWLKVVHRYDNGIFAQSEKLGVNTPKKVIPR